MKADCTHVFQVADYDLAATLDCGQAFRWHRHRDGWQGVLADKWVCLRQDGGHLEARTMLPQTGWDWLRDYLQIDADLGRIVAGFPPDPHLQAAVHQHRGLRLLRQPPWECLASFILSSTKQIVQIRQIIILLCARFGRRVAAPDAAVWHSFPEPARLAGLTESELQTCKMGFRAKYLLGAAQAVASGRLNLEHLHTRPPAEARAALLQLEGVGDKIADCVRLFAYGHADAFPVDVWVARALRQYYFRGRQVPLPRLREFAAQRWQQCGGYAQQYLFHHIRQNHGKTARAVRRDP